MLLTRANWQRFVDRTGVASLYLFAFCAWLSSAGASVGLGLMVMALIVSPSARAALKRDPLAMLCLVFAFYLLLGIVYATREFPATAQLQRREALDWLQLWFFLVMAWWLSADLGRLNRVLALALAGFLIGMLSHADWSRLHALLAGERTGFQLRAIAFGLYSSTALLGLLLLAPRVWGSSRNFRIRALRVTAWLAAIVILTQGLISTQSRGAWLAAVMIIPPLTLWRSWIWLRDNDVPARRLAAAFGLLVILFAGILYWNHNVIKNRLYQEQSSVAALEQLDFERLPVSSISWRLHLYEFGMQKWMQRPFVGWGPGSTKYLISHSGRTELLHPTWKGGMDWLDHLHNSYLEMLVRFGLLGALLLLAAFVLLLKALWRAYRSGRLPADYTLFIAGAFGLTAIWSLFDFRLLHPDWRYYWLLLAGAAYTFHLHRLALSGNKADREPAHE